MIEPVVRHFVVCSDVIVEQTPPYLESLLGALYGLDAPPDTAFPFDALPFSVYVAMTGCRGPAFGRVRVAAAETNDVVYLGTDKVLDLANDPLAVQARAFRVVDVRFETPGVYDVQFWYNGRLLVQQPLTVE